MTIFSQPLSHGSTLTKRTPRIVRSSAASPAPRKFYTPEQPHRKDNAMYFLENYRGFGVYLTGSGYIARNRKRILTAKTYAEMIQCINLWTCC
jgi:hypothetical protein